MKLFTVRSMAAGCIAGALVAILWNVVGAPWGLGILNGVAIAAIVVIGRQAYVLGRITTRRIPGIRPWFGVYMLVYAVLLGSSTSVRFFVELDVASEFAVSMLILSTGLAAYCGGDIVATLDHRDSDPAAEGRTLAEAPLGRHQAS